MSRKLTYEEVKHYIEVESNSGCKLLSKEYINVDSSIEIEDINGHKFITTFADFKHFKKYLCNECSFKKNGIKQSKTYEDFTNEVFNKVGNKYNFLTKYINSHIKVKVQCKIDGYIWDVSPTKFLTNNCKCPKCSNCVKNKTTDYFKQEVFELVGDEYDVLGEYSGAKNKLLMRHNICGCKWDISPTNFLKGRRCPDCEISKGEERINSYFMDKGFIKIIDDDYKLLDNNFKEKYRYYIPQKKFDGLLGLGNGLLSYDFYLPQYNLLIEYQGEFHDGNTRKQTKKDIVKQVEHDRRKREYALNYNIVLLEIWYYDFDNIENILDDYFNKENNINIKAI